MVGQVSKDFSQWKKLVGMQKSNKRKSTSTGNLTLCLTLWSYKQVSYKTPLFAVLELISNLTVT